MPDDSRVSPKAGAAPAQRRPRFGRDLDATPPVLTARDVAVIQTCWEFRWLTRGQLQQLLPLPGVNRTNDRLRRLYDAGYLQRLRAGTVGAGLQPVYAAGAASVSLLADYAGCDLARVRSRLREDGRASAALLPHDLQVNDLRLALTGALQGAELPLEGWWNAHDCYDAYAAGRSLRPDGYFQFWEGETLHACFLELDRGTTGLARWRTKVARYREYREGGAYFRRYGLHRFRVLVTAPAPDRLRHLWETTRAITDRGFWFALTDAVQDDPDPHGPLWWPLAGEAPRALVGGPDPRGGM